MYEPVLSVPTRSNINRAVQSQKRLEILDSESRGIVLSM